MDVPKRVRFVFDLRAEARDMFLQNSSHLRSEVIAVLVRCYLGTDVPWRKGATLDLVRRRVLETSTHS
jgi:hypothetical protein